jgi:hypothetical protein
MTKHRNAAIGALVGGAMPIGSPSTLCSSSRKRAAKGGLAALVSAAALLVTLGVAPASATPPDRCIHLSDVPSYKKKIKGSKLTRFTMCMWHKGGDLIDVTYSGTIKDTAADGARAQLQGCVDCYAPSPADPVLREAVGKGAEVNFGRAAGGGIVRGTTGVLLHLTTYDKSEGSIEDLGDEIGFPFRP